MSDAMRLSLADLRLISPGAVRIEGPGISITAGAMDLNTPPEGAVLSFTGGVRLLYQPED
jgi:hypothetical protein